MLTSTPSRSHRSKTRSIAVALVVLVVLAVLAGAGYAVTRGSTTPAAKPSSAPSTITSSAAPSVAPSTAAVSDVVAFVSLPIGSPPTSGTNDRRFAWYRLTASLAGPHSAAVGSTAPFTVTLTNATTTSIALSPCPAFDLTVGYQTTSYGLNCAGAANDVIAPGGTLTFALPVPISHSLATGSTTDVSWSLGWQPDSHSPHAHQAVRVTG